MEAELTQLDRDGYVVLRGVLSASELAELTAALAPYEAQRPMGRNSFEGERSQRIYSLAGKGAVFQRLAEHPRILALADHALLPHFLLSTMQSIRLHPGETEQPWHTDDAFYGVPRPRAGRLALSVIWALEDFTRETGATELVPGSHRWGSEHPDDRAHGASPATGTVFAEMSAGSAVVFDGALWHRGGANRSAARTRLAISPQYCQPWLRPQESQLLIVPPEAARAASERVREMLGYSIHPPFIGQVDGMHPMRLVDPDYRARKGDARKVADQVLDRPQSDMTAQVARADASER